MDNSLFGHIPAVRLTTDAVPAVMASTWEWISCLDSSTLFWTHILDAFLGEKRGSVFRDFVPHYEISSTGKWSM